MLGDSLPEYILIRTCIFLLQYTTPLCLLLWALIGLAYGPAALFSWRISWVLIAYSVADALFAVFIWIPSNRRLQQKARHPPPLTREERQALYHRCMDNIEDFDHYMRLWFLGAGDDDVRRENARDFVLWAFFDCGPETASEAVLAEADSYVDDGERRLGRKFAPGRGPAQCLRLTLDKVETRYRSVCWYVIIAAVDHITHVGMVRRGFQYYAQAGASFYSGIPFRMQNLLCRRRSESRELGYWLRPHTSKDKMPVVFLHGIGVGLLTYLDFFSRINPSSDPDDQIGVLVVELLPISFRLTDSPLDREQFLEQMESILERHQINRFLLSAHSYGSVLASHMLQSETFSSRIQSVVLIDPVSLLLHLPDVAYNFTRRQPRKASEWQLWYFASMDPGVAHTLGRHFFWRENIIWKEGLLEHLVEKAPTPDDNSNRNHDGNRAPTQNTHRKKRNVAVCLAECDLIVDTAMVAKYLGGVEWAPVGYSKLSGATSPKNTGSYKTEDGDIEVLWFPGLDHAQVLDTQRDQDRICKVIRHYCKW